MKICQNPLPYQSYRQRPTVLQCQNIAAHSQGHSPEIHNMSRVMRKPNFCISENKGKAQQRGNHAADQRHCFRYVDSRTKSEILSL